MPRDAVDCLEEVLNAFRHHRGSHVRREARAISDIVCSTPFGITEVLTSAFGNKYCEAPSAQRLSASQRFSRTTRGRTSRGTRCAQRLSASQRFSRKLA